MNSADVSLTAGRPWPMGASLAGNGVNFAVFSADADLIELCLYSPDGRHELARLPKTRSSDTEEQ